MSNLNLRHWLSISNEEHKEESEVVVQTGDTPKEGLTDATNTEVDVETSKPAVAELPASAEAEVKTTTVEDEHQTVEKKVVEGGEDKPNEAAGEGDVPASNDMINADDKGAGTTEVSIEDYLQVSTEGFMGGLLGFLTGSAAGVIPFVGPAVHAGVKAKRMKMKEDIETIAKRIAQVRNGNLEEAKKKGVELPAKLKNVDSGEIIKGALLGMFFGPFYGIRQGSQLQNLNDELQAKIKELQDEMERAGISKEDFTPAEVPADIQEPEVVETKDISGVDQPVDEAGDEVTKVEEDINHFEKVATALENYANILKAGIESGEGIAPETATVIRIGIESLDPYFAEEAVVLSQESFGGDSSCLTATKITLGRVEEAQVAVGKALAAARAMVTA